MSTAENNDSVAPPARRPIIIEGNWTVADLTTLADCDDALAILEDQAEGIETDLEAEDKNPARDDEWCCKAEKALSFKKIGIRQVKALRERILADTTFARFKAVVKGLDPALYDRAMSIAAGAH